MNDHIPDLTKMISDTPRTDAAYFKPHATMYDLAGEMKLIERELNAANERIKRLESTGDELLEWLKDQTISDSNYRLLANAWQRAKENKR